MTTQDISPTKFSKIDRALIKKKDLTLIKIIGVNRKVHYQVKRLAGKPKSYDEGRRKFTRLRSVVEKYSLKRI